MKEITQEQLDKRIEAVHDAVKRTRSAFLLCILVPGAMFLCLWNTYASWDRDFAFLGLDYFPKLYDKPEHQVPPDQIAKMIRENTQLFDEKKNAVSPEQIMTAAWEKYNAMLPPSLQDHQMRSWIETQVVAVTLLGIKISVSDFAIIGSLALFLCNLYSLLCIRRENHEIGYLFQDLREKMADFGYHAFAMVSSFMVFNLSATHLFGPRTDGPIKFLEKKRNPPQRIPFMRAASYILDFLPTITIISTIICDFGWTHMTFSPGHGHQFFVSAFRPQIGQDTPYAQFEAGERIYFWCAESFALLAAFTLFAMTRLIKGYEGGTRSLLEEVYKELRSKHGLEPEWPEDPTDQEVKEPKGSPKAGSAAAGSVP